MPPTSLNPSRLTVRQSPKHLKLIKLYPHNMAEPAQHTYWHNPPTRNHTQHQFCYPPSHKSTGPQPCKHERKLSLNTIWVRNSPIVHTDTTSSPRTPPPSENHSTTSYVPYNAIGSSETQTIYTQTIKLEPDGLNQSTDDSPMTRYLPPKYNAINRPLN